MKKRFLRLTNASGDEVLVNLANVTMITRHDASEEITKICLSDGNVITIDAPFEKVAHEIPEECFAYD